MARKSYPSDLTDEQWKILELFMPEPKDDGRDRIYELREIMNGIFYVLRTGCSWRSVPHDLPPWESVYGYYRLWSKDGTWEKINNEMREELRNVMGREKQPSKAIIDSQSVKTTEKGGSKVSTRVKR